MQIINALTEQRYPIHVGTLGERKFIRVGDGYSPGAPDKKFFESEGEYKIYKILLENPKLEQYKTVMVNRVKHINSNWEEFTKWVTDPGSSTFKL